MLLTARLEPLHDRDTGLRVPPVLLASLAEGDEPAVRVTFPNGHVLRTTVTTWEGEAVVPVGAATRQAAVVAAGDLLEVDVVLDRASRELAVPEDLGAALAANDEARAWFEELTDAQRRAFVGSVLAVQRPATRARRVERVVTALEQRRRRP